VKLLNIVFRSIGLMFATMLVVIGYVVAPMLFSSLDQVTAGNLVSQLLSYANSALLISLFGLLIIVIGRIDRFVHNWLLIISVLIVLSTEYWISPLMKTIKAAYPSGLTKASPDWSTFAMWHGIYQLLFLILILALFIWSLINLKHMILNNKKYDKKSL